MSEKIFRRTVTDEIIETNGQQKKQATFTTEPKKWIKKRHKLGTVRERCEDLIELQFPAREVAYSKLRMDLITKLGLCDRSTVLAYLGRPKQTRVFKTKQMVTYLRSGSRVLKDHVFTSDVTKKKGYIEIFGLATMFNHEETGRAFFRINYEMSNRAYHYEQLLARYLNTESEEVKTENVPSNISLSPIITTPTDKKEGSDESTMILEKEKRESSLNMRERNMLDTA